MPAVEVDDRALLGALAAFKSLDADVRKQTASAVRGTLRPLWRNVMATRRTTAAFSIHPTMDAMATDGIAFSSSGKGALKAYNLRRTLSGGLSTDTWWAVEFGTTKPGYAGTRLPRRQPSGRIAYRGVTSWAPTAARVYLGVLYDVLRDIPGVEDG